MKASWVDGIALQHYEKIDSAGMRLRFEISVAARSHRGVESRLTRGCGLKGVFIKELIEPKDLISGGIDRSKDTCYRK
jgi:hypothetical protein